ncbi:MAG TPA: flagellar basal body rod protein FlgB [Methylomirabilota bacterium]|nr:flagellar basal body rod protein FlgB [Methylomirabilota bacterium]
MDISGLGLFRMITQQLHWLGQRQDVLSQNVANADTPGYQARDLKPLSFDDQLRQSTAMRLAVTEPGHLTGRGADPEAAATKPVTPWEVSPDGNGVILEQQMTALAETQANYQMATELYRKQIGMLKTAIGSKSSS